MCLSGCQLAAADLSLSSCQPCMADRLKSAFLSEKLALVPLFRNKKAYFTMLVCYDRVLYVVFHVSFLSASTISCLISYSLTANASRRRSGRRRG